MRSVGQPVWSRRVVQRGIAVVVCVVLSAAVGGRAGTSRIDDSELSVRRLKADKRAIALVRVGAASQKCLHVAVMIGVPAGEGYRRERVMAVANVRSLAKAPVAEAEFDAGEYHVIGYACTNDKGTKAIADDTGPMSPIYRTSYARFTLQPGEVINLGFLHFHAELDGDSVFGRPIKTAVGVSDWPIEELERFARSRPALYALMTTRLMEVPAVPTGPAVSAQACTNWRVLASSGKIQHVPAGC